MKKGLIIFAGIVLVFSSCGQGKTEEKPKEDTTAKVEVRDMKGLKIAYYNNDSLKLYFDYFKEQEAIVTKRQTNFQKEVERKTRDYQNYIRNNNEKLRSGLLSQNEQMQVQQRAQQMEGELMQYQQNEGSKLEAETMEKLQDITKKIEAWGKMFSEENKIDLLLMHGPGGQINFVNPSLDVTKEFTAFLNQKQAEIEKDIKK